MAAPTSTVLVVSDDDHVSEETRYGFPDEVEVLEVVDSRQAGRLLETTRPDLVIVALRTGNSGGFALARDMSQRNDLKDVPVMILLEREQDRWLAGQAGAEWCEAKPVNPGRLVADALLLLEQESAS